MCNCRNNKSHMSSQCGAKRQILCSPRYFINFAAQKKPPKGEGEFVGAIVLHMVLY